MKKGYEMSELEIQMAMSAAFDYIGKITLEIPVDVSNKEERNNALSVCLTELVSALDNGRIAFLDEYDKAMFHKLLAVAGDIVMDGRLKECFDKVTLN